MKRLCLFMAIGSVCAWSIDIPRIGFARDAQGRVVVVNGIAGNFLVDETASIVVSTAFSWNGITGLRKTEATVELWDASGAVSATFDAPAAGEAAAVVGFGSQDAWLYSNSNLYRVSPLRMQQVPVSLSSTEEVVLALAGGRKTIDIAVRRAGAVYVATFDLGSGARVAEAPIARAASTALLFLDDGRMAGVDGSTLWVTRADGSEWSVDTGVVALEGMAWMGREWIQAGNGLALRIRAGAEPALYVLPRTVVAE